MTIFKKHWLRIATHVACWLPFVVLVWDFANDNLTVNPIQEATLRTGKTALILLVLALACTPANTLFGLRKVLPLRRPLGLYAFFYVCLHLLIFVLVDYGLNWGLIEQAIVEKRFVLAGFAAFLLLLPLAITSTKGWMRRLGKGWKKLHRLVYVAAPLAVAHFVWLVKSDVREPLAYGALVGALLLLRAPVVRGRLAKLRARLAGDRRATDSKLPARPSATD
jgi:sulfoxide reductase heme-binding subunit YedZ